MHRGQFNYITGHLDTEFYNVAMRALSYGYGLEFRV